MPLNAGNINVQLALNCVAKDIALVCAFSSLFVLAVGTLPPLYHLCLPSLNNMAVLLDGHNNL